MIVLTQHHRPNSANTLRSEVDMKGTGVVATAIGHDTGGAFTDPHNYGDSKIVFTQAGKVIGSIRPKDLGYRANFAWMKLIGDRDSTGYSLMWVIDDYSMADGPHLGCVFFFHAKVINHRLQLNFKGELCSVLFPEIRGVQNHHWVIVFHKISQTHWGAMPYWPQCYEEINGTVTNIDANLPSVYEQMVPDVQTALNTAPTDPDLLEAYGYILRVTGKKDNAVAFYRSHLPTAGDIAFADHDGEVAAGEDPLRVQRRNLKLWIRTKRNWPIGWETNAHAYAGFEAQDVVPDGWVQHFGIFHPKGKKLMWRFKLRPFDKEP